MSRPILSLNLKEDEAIARIDRARERQRAAQAPKPKPRRERPDEYVILNGRTYVPATDLMRDQADKALRRTHQGSGGR